ncbi:uncharacterized protein LOC129333901 [Eublepharis macularius]|uniref:Uncharacterized protein LOC129333901 n=1 Tax=Eublepharis macularius TaxID=481883 RepID=A0AA97L4N9_EUBMA|nr:uncharacterized protein LOC129333901 [Eublepharis macularius]
MENSINVRTATWREREIIDLLDLWGEDKIQEALRRSHRNIDCFRKIANQMAARGHKRSALECRNKTKSMRLEYKRVIAHNGTSGNAPTTCAYFRELHSILRGDASVKPKRIARSLNLAVQESSKHPDVTPADGSEELFSHDLVTVDYEQIRSSTPAPRAHSSMSTEEETDCDLDHTIDGLADKENMEPCNDAQEDWTSDPVVPSSPKESCPGGYPMDLAELSPGTRLSKIRNRKRKNAALFGVADRMLSQAKEVHREQLDEWRIERKETVKWLEEDKRVQREFLEETRQERSDLRASWRENLEVMKTAVSTLQTLGEIMVQQRLSNAPSELGNTQQESQTTATRNVNVRRACVE